MCANDIDEDDELFADLEDEEDLMEEDELFEDLDEEEVAEEDEPVVESGSKMSSTLGMALLLLGVIGMVGIIAIKFTSTGPTDEFMGITNPEGVYGEYFLSGVAGGLVLAVIGLVLTVKGKAQPSKLIVEEDEPEEEVFEEELEDEEEGICPTCGAIILITCSECPECGEELEASEEEEFEEDFEEELEEEPLGETIGCPICGTELPADATECTECGEPLEKTEEEDDDLFADLEDL